MSEQPLYYLDRIPDEIYRRLVTHRSRAEKRQLNQHSLQYRCLSVLEIRDHLVNAEVISLSVLENWLNSDSASFLYKKLSDPQLLIKTRNNSTYTDEVIIHILDWLDQPDSELKSDHQKQKPDVSDASQTRADSSVGDVQQNDSQPAESVPLDAPPENSMPDLTDKKANQTYHSIQNLNKRFALQRQLGWDLTKGIKSETDVQLLLKFHKIIKNSNHLQSIIRMIGRRKINYLDEIPESGMHQKPLAGASLQNSLPDDHSVNSVTGVYYGDDIARMLPAELVLLSHPRLKMLWHAKRAERQLLNYHFQGVSSDHVAEIQAKSLHEEVQGKQAIEQQGPMVLCIDTSASMKGKPENIAKAIAFEAMRVARLEQRPCYVFSFSGENEVEELELDLLLSGWQPVIDFLKFSFHGGTDINAVLHRALDKVMQSNWTKADLVLISDGRFKIEKSAIHNISSLDQGTRIFGIQVSRWNSASFGDFCHRVFTFNNV